MFRSFLIGRFLQSHAGAYQYHPKPKANVPHLTRETLERRFRERAHRFRMKRHGHLFTLQAGFAFALMIIIGAFNLDLRPQEAEPIFAAEQEVVTMQEILQTRQEIKPPPPPPPPIPIEVPDDTILEDDELPLGDPLDFSEPLPLPPPPTPDPVTEFEEEELFTVVEEMPSIVGGHAALTASLNYPLIAQRAGIEGMVVVQIVVDTDGTPTDPVVVRSAHDVLDKEAVAAVMQQQFRPGRQRGKAVRVRMSIPVKFKLQS